MAFLPFANLYLHWMAILYVFLGGGLGSLCRYGIAQLFPPPQSLFPISTLISNALACIILGYLMGMALQKGLDKTTLLLLATGFCGGFSTFSTFSYENFHLFEQANYGFLLINIMISVSLCFICIFLGFKLGSQP